MTTPTNPAQNGLDFDQLFEQINAAFAGLCAPILATKTELILFGAQLEVLKWRLRRPSRGWRRHVRRMKARYNERA